MKLEWFLLAGPMFLSLHSCWARIWSNLLPRTYYCWLKLSFTHSIVFFLSSVKFDNVIHHWSEGIEIQYQIPQHFTEWTKSSIDSMVVHWGIEIVQRRRRTGEEKQETCVWFTWGIACYTVCGSLVCFYYIKFVRNRMRAMA